MSTCDRCGKTVGPLRHGPLCAACTAEDRNGRLRESAVAIAQIRASGGDDEEAKVSLTRLLADERLDMGKSAGEPTVAALAAAALGEERSRPKTRQARRMTVRYWLWTQWRQLCRRA
jgi:hypothetical protein